LNLLHCMCLHSYSISIRGGTQGHRDTTQITLTYVSPFILHLYSRWNTGTQGHNSNPLFCLSLHSYSISIQGGTRGHRDTTRITYTVCFSLYTQSLFEVGHRDTLQIPCSVCLSIHTQSLFEVGHRDTTLINCSVCLSIPTQSLFEVGHRDTT
jgi:hypothetical protein